MDKAELKRVLRHAQDAPVHVAFALGADSKAIMVMDRRKPPRALEKELKEAAPDSKNSRFGTASVDPAEPKLVRFTVNKAASGMGRKLAVALKGTGFSKVELGSDDGAPPERAEEKDEPEEASAAAHGGAGATASGAAAAGAEAAGEAGAAAAAAGAGSEAAAGTGIEAAAAAAAGARTAAEAGTAGAVAAGAAAAADAAAGARQANPPDAGQLVAKLTPKVRQMLELVGKHPEQKAALQKLATTAQTTLRGAMLTLKREDLEKASSGIDAFCQAVDQAAAGAGGAAQGGAVASAATDQAGRPAVQGPKQPSPQHVTHRLTQAAKQAAPLLQAGAHADPAKAALAALAAQVKQHLTQAHAALKGGDLAAAGRHTAELERMLGGLGGMEVGGMEPGGLGLGGLGPTIGAAAAPGSLQGNAAAQALGARAGKGARTPDPALAKAAHGWVGIVKGVEAEAQRLHDGFAKAFGKHGAAERMIKGFSDTLQQAVHTIGDGLAHKLHELSTAADPTHHEKLAQEVKATVRQHLEHIAKNPLLAVVDSNPMIPVQIKKALVTGLDGILRIASAPYNTVRSAEEAAHGAAGGAAGRR